MLEGSPPHARGRPAKKAGSSFERRITPACAGKTVSLPQALGLGRDHPRMRGEDTSLKPVVSKKFGSPPHARGRHGTPLTDTAKAGITPACAGKTVSCSRVGALCRDHPRMRGEDSWRSSRPTSPSGSPPHARGRLHAGPVDEKPERITPACAGKTHSSPILISRLHLDHPRMRGEDAIYYVDPITVGGSPPHARGRLVPCATDSV